jgi:hypothetical protein
MNGKESIDLKKLIGNFKDEYVDNTDNIRKLKHSELIRDDIRKLELLKINNPELMKTAPFKFGELAQSEAFFLFSNYTDIFNKVVKNELDLDIMSQILSLLKLIEENQVDQNEGSVLVGKLLKELYVDSALKRSEHLDLEHADDLKPETNNGKNIDWRSWKHQKNTHISQNEK